MWYYFEEAEVEYLGEIISGNGRKVNDLT